MTEFRCRSCCYGFLKHNCLILLTLVGVVFGAAVGAKLRPYHLSNDALTWLGLPGHLYLNMLRMMIVPLVVSSIIVGTSSLDPKVNGKVGAIAVFYILLTNMIGALLGIGVFLIFRPGVPNAEYLVGNQTGCRPTETQDVFLDLIRNIFPPNLFEATFRQVRTDYEVTAKDDGNGSVIETVTKNIIKFDGTNLLGLIISFTVMGMAVSAIGDRGRRLLELMEACYHTVLRMMTWYMWVTPVGVFSLILVAIAAVSDISHVFQQLGLLIGAVTVGIVVQQTVVLPLILFGFTRRNPLHHWISVSRAWLIGFVTASTAVALPEMLHASDTKLNLHRGVSSFVLPLTVTLSANGSAVYITASCLFVTNITGNALTAGTIVLVGLLTTVSAMAIPSVPSASIVTVIMILTSLNIPLEAIALLLAVEFCLDRIRTSSSVLSNTVCVAVCEQLCKKDLEQHIPKLQDDIDLKNAEVTSHPELEHLLTQIGSRC